MIDMAEKLAEKTTKKRQKSRLSHKEKLEVCRLLGSGHTMNEVAQTMSKKTGKSIGIWQVRHYLDSPKWGSLIRTARDADIQNAEKIAIFSTTGRVRKYDRLLEIFEKKFYCSIQDIESQAEKNLDRESSLQTFKILKLAGSYMLKILREIRVEEYEALENKSAGSEGEVEDFFMLVEKRVIASRRRRDPDRELEKAAGML